MIHKCLKCRAYTPTVDVLNFEEDYPLSSGECPKCGGTALEVDGQEIDAALDALKLHMESRGWHVENTGGGCQAWASQPDNNAQGYFWYITEVDDPSLPATPWTPVALGLYRTTEDGDDESILCLPHVANCFTAAQLADSAEIAGMYKHTNRETK